MRTAEFFRDSEKFTDCFLCPNFCRIIEGKRGRCLGRGRLNGTMFLYNYGRVVTAHLDPIEKKPLYHFHPGKAVFSVGTFGCNLSCRFCQNHDLSQKIVPSETVEPEELVEAVPIDRDNVGIAFTYNEPGIWFEFIKDCAPLIRKRGRKIVLVTNGYLEEQPFRDLCAVTDAMNIDLKAFSESFYRDVCGGAIEPVKRNIRIARESGVHVELTNLVITGLNDGVDEFEKLTDWVSEVSPDLPFHLSRYFPRYKETAPATSPRTLEEFSRIARKKLRFVYVGNLATEDGQDTRCPDCGNPLIRRSGYSTTIEVSGDACVCGKSLASMGIRKGP